MDSENQYRVYFYNPRDPSSSESPTVSTTAAAVPLTLCNGSNYLGCKRDVTGYITIGMRN